MGNCHDLKIIQPREDALPGNSQTAGKDGEMQIRIRFQRVAKKVPEEGDHLPVIGPLGMHGLVQGNVVFVN